MKKPIDKSINTSKGINVIGGGPAGLYASYLLAKRGFKPKIYEEHKNIGSPVQCTGIVTKEFKHYIKEKDSIINSIREIKLISGKEQLIIPTEEYILDRKIFDSSLAEKALSEGAKIIHKRFIPKLIPKKQENSILIGADGPFSLTQKTFMPRQRRYFFGLQARVKIRTDPEQYEVRLGTPFDNFFAWMVPESENIARLGLASTSNPNQAFKSLLKIYKNPKIIEHQNGVIPIFDPKQKVEDRKNKIYLIGDAAGHVKATTGGGIIPSFIAAHALKDSILDDSSYTKNLKSLNKRLYTHLMLRRILNSFKNKDYTLLFNYLNKENIRPVFKSTSREYPAKLLLTLIAKQPLLLRFAPFIFKAKSL